MAVTEQIRRGTLLAGRYEVVRRLGAGGMATVFLAEDTKLDRDVAVKRLHTDAPKASLTRFKREAKLGAALNHPNLVAVYDTVVTDDGDALIVMEYVPGESLADIAAQGVLSAERAIPILRAVGDALDHAHAADVVHRDVKPANVLVRDDGVVKLADLGIAKAVGATQLTSEGSVIGTLPYMSPERMAGAGAGGPEADVYALAAVAYELLSGEPPRETTSTEAREDHRSEMEASLADAPPAAAAVLQRGMDPDPERRPTTATRLVEDLDSALTGESPVRVVPFEPPTPAPSPRRTAPTRRADDSPTAERPAITATRGGRKRKGGRGLAILAIGGVLAVVAAIALGAGGGEDGGGGDAKAKPDDEPADTQASAEPAPAPAPEPDPAPEPEPEPDGAELNDQGFELNSQGRYEEAIPILEEAVALLEDSGDDLTYSYAIFNLAEAYLGAGRPEEAIPLFEERLQYPGSTGEVQGALEEALGALGGFPDGSGGPGGNGRGNAFGHDNGQGGDED